MLKSSVLNVGYNTVVKTKEKLISTHAEVQALKNANLHSLRNKIIDLYVIRVAKGGSLCSSRPCANCVAYMIKISKKYDFTIKHIYYSDSLTVIAKKKLSELSINPHMTKFEKGYYFMS